MKEIFLSSIFTTIRVMALAFDEVVMIDTVEDDHGVDYVELASVDVQEVWKEVRWISPISLDIYLNMAHILHSLRVFSNNHRL